MERKIRAYKNYFTDFIFSINESEAKKVFYVIDMLKVQERLSAKFVKYIEDGIFELRAEHSGKIFRVFFIFDENDIVLFLMGSRKRARRLPEKKLNRQRN